jgi:hypothetical protein
MIEEGKRLPDGSRERRRLISRIILIIQNSRQIAQNCPSFMMHPRLSYAENQQNYEDALQDTYIWFGNHCFEYDPNQAQDPASACVIGWFRYYLKLNKWSVDRRYSHENIGRVPIGGRSITQYIENLVCSHSSNLQDTVEQQHLLTAIRECIQECSILRTKTVFNRLDITCQDLLLLRLPKYDEAEQRVIRGRTWNELEEIFNVPRKHLTSCYNSYHRDRRCLECLKACLIRKGVNVI